MSPETYSLSTGGCYWIVELFVKKWRGRYFGHVLLLAWWESIYHSPQGCVLPVLFQAQTCHFIEKNSISQKLTGQHQEIDGSRFKPQQPLAIFGIFGMFFLGGGRGGGACCKSQSQLWSTMSARLSNQHGKSAVSQNFCAWLALALANTNCLATFVPGQTPAQINGPPKT